MRGQKETSISVNQNLLNNKKPVAPSEVNTGSELQLNNNTGEIHMNSTNKDYTNNTQDSPSDNVVQIKSKTTDDSLLIKEGIYEAVLITWETEIMFGKPKLIMQFKIIEFGEHLDKTFTKFYYVKRHKGKPCKKGKFIAKNSGDLLEHWYRVFPESSRIRPDRVPIQNLLNKPVKIKVKTVKDNYKNKLMPEQMFYSKVDEIMPI